MKLVKIIAATAAMSAATVGIAHAYDPIKALVSFEISAKYCNLAAPDLVQFTAIEDAVKAYGNFKTVHEIVKFEFTMFEAALYEAKPSYRTQVLNEYCEFIRGKNEKYYADTK